eukprot:jgi/Undpi1/10288/HiC_scaffold_28.g12740.m1
MTFFLSSPTQRFAAPPPGGGGGGVVGGGVGGGAVCLEVGGGRRHVYEEGGAGAGSGREPLRQAVLDLDTVGSAGDGRHSRYYGEVLSKKPVELHRFYTDESTFCHASGTREEEPVSGLADIKAKIEHLGLGGATVDLGCGSVDAQPSEAGGVLLMVTGSITIADLEPRQFCQTFFLSRQHQDNDRHNYFVRNAIFRFLDVLPEVVEAALKARDEEEGATSRSMPAAGPVGGSDDVVAAGEGVAEIQNVSPLDAPAVAAASVAETAGAPADAITSSSSMSVGAAPPSESHVAASAAGGGVTGGVGGGTDAVPVPAPQMGNGSGSKASVKVAPPAVVVASPSTPAAVTPAASLAPEASAAPPTPPAAALPDAPTPALPASPLPAVPVAAPVPAAPTTYASMAKSWATVAAVGGDVSAAPGLSGGGVGAPATSGIPGVGVVSGNNGVVAAAAPVSNGGWGVPDAAVVAPGVGGGVGVGGTAAVAPVGGAGVVVEQPLLSQAGSGGGQGSSRPPSASGKSQKGSSLHIPHHASPAVAASAAAAREAAAAGNGEIMPATSLFVRKVDMTIDREEMVAHFSAYGDVTGISMNPTRGYAFIDYRTNECVQSALSTKEHYVNRKLLVVEERHSPMLRPSRGEHGVGGRGGRNGGRGRGTGGRDGRDAERGDRRSTGGRTGRGGGGMGRGDRPDGPGPKDGGGSYKARGRAEPA